MRSHPLDCLDCAYRPTFTATAVIEIRKRRHNFPQIEWLMGEMGWKGFIAPFGVLGVLPKAIGAPNGRTYDRAKPWTKRRLKYQRQGEKGKSDEKAPTAPILVSKLIAVYTHFDVCRGPWPVRKKLHAKQRF